MSPGKLTIVVAACLVLLAADNASPGHILQTERSSSSDLEIGGMVAPGTPRYISKERLLSLPQVTVTITGDENFRELPQQKLSITGVSLDVLESTLGILPGSDLLTTLCEDGYHATFTREYVQTHRPILALKIDGLPIETWVGHTHNYDPGPYFITQANFIPSFSVLSFQEIPKVPSKIVRLEFGTAEQVYGAIAPHQKEPVNPQIVEGFRIAKQHCYRCHNMGSYGGVKGGKSWNTLGAYAASSPSPFERYLRNPKSIDPESKMPPNPGFDDAVAKALQTYFQTFAVGAPR